MTNKSAKSPSGEDRERPNNHIRKQEISKKDITDHSGIIKSRPSQRKGQENLSNRGYEEDQPHHPVRASGSMKKSQETLPTGEPDPGEVKTNTKKKKGKNLTGPGLG